MTSWGSSSPLRGIATQAACQGQVCLTWSSSPLRGIATRPRQLRCGASGVLITPQRDRNSSRAIITLPTSCPHHPSEGSQHGLDAPAGQGPPGPHHPSEGSQRRMSTARPPRPCPHHPSEGSQLRDDREIVATGYGVLITPQRDRNLRGGHPHHGAARSSSPLRGIATQHRE